MITRNRKLETIFMTSYITYNVNNIRINQYIRTTPGKILFNTVLQKALKKRKLI
jgi:hypothetical protein